MADDPPEVFDAGIDPAVEVFWQSQPNKLYQVLASDSPTTPVWSDVGAPVVGTGAEVRRVLLRGDADHRFFRVQALPGTVTNWLAGLTELDFRPARLTPQAGGFLAEGLRANAVGITTDDLVSARFQFEEETQSLRLVHYDVVPEIGVFNDRFFARDVPELTNATIDGTSIPAYSVVPISGTNILLHLELLPGHVLNWAFDSNMTQEYSVELLDPQGQLLGGFIGAPNFAVTAEGIPIFRGGSYQLRIRSRAASPEIPVSGSLLFANNNHLPLTPAGHGMQLSATLRANTHDYAKYSLNLTQGQIVRLPALTSEIGFLVLNARSQRMASNEGVPLIFEAPASGVYYLFIYKVRQSFTQIEFTAPLTIEN